MCFHDDKADAVFHRKWLMLYRSAQSKQELRQPWDRPERQRRGQLGQPVKTAHNHGDASKAMRGKRLFHSMPQCHFLCLKLTRFHLITATFMSASAGTRHTERHIHILKTVPKIKLVLSIYAKRQWRVTTPSLTASPNKKKDFFILDFEHKKITRHLNLASLSFSSFE